MAITVKEARKAQKEKFEKDFDSNELEYIHALEDFIDNKITEGMEHSETISMKTSITDLEESLKGHEAKFKVIAGYRRRRISDYIIRLYKNVGWDISIESDYGQGAYYSYMIMKPKKD
jgi:hypothetical protein